MLRNLALAFALVVAPAAAHASRNKEPAPRAPKSSSAKESKSGKAEKSSKGSPDKSRSSGHASKGGEHARESARKPSLPAIEMQHLSTHETFVLRPDTGGHLGGKQLKGFKHFLRCHHTGREHAMNPHLAELLYKTAHHFGDREITVVAGYRAPKIAKKKGNPKSPHKRGVACDFRVAGVDNETLRDYLRETFHGVGVGYYPNSGFIHLDVDRARSAFWIDYSGPGERAEYSSDPDGDLKSGIVDARRRGATGEGDDAVEPGDDDEPFADDPGLAGLAIPPPPPL